jgi:hypothetical protein
MCVFVCVSECMFGSPATHMCTYTYTLQSSLSIHTPTIRTDIVFLDTDIWVWVSDVGNSHKSIVTALHLYWVLPLGSSSVAKNSTYSSASYLNSARNSAKFKTWGRRRNSVVTFSRKVHSMHKETYLDIMLQAQRGRRSASGQDRRSQTAVQHHHTFCTHQWLNHDWHTILWHIRVSRSYYINTRIQHPGDTQWRSRPLVWSIRFTVMCCRKKKKKLTSFK